MTSIPPLDSACLWDCVQRETFFAILLIALVANLCLMLIALMYRRRGRTTREPAVTRRATRQDVPRSDAPTPAGALVDAVALTTADGSEGHAVAPPIAAMTPPIAEARVPQPAGADPLTDAETGLLTWLAWDDMLRAESARSARYHRDVTVVVAELDGLDALAARLGRDVADGLVRPVADALRRNARAADRIARVGHARFAAMLPETDEIGAINYIERVRSSCDMWLEAGALAVRLVIGWASPATGDLEAAVLLAEERMNASRRRPKADSAAGPDPWARTAARRGPERRRTAGQGDVPGPTVIPTEA